MAAKTHFSVEQISIEPISEKDINSLSVFHCGLKDMDEFIHEHLAVLNKSRYLSAYKCVLKDTDAIVGVFSLANDIISIDVEDKWDFKNVDSEYLDIFKSQNSHPAINVCHLAVAEDYQLNGLGFILMQIIKESVISNHFSGCQFLTVDAVSSAVGFYEKLGFEYKTLSDVDKPTRRMYLDLFTTAHI